MHNDDLKPLTSIRGLAVMWVMLHHMTLYYRYPHMGPFTLILFTGFIGVDIFFVLSGFILTLVYRNLGASGLAKFALRRIFRIYPLHLTVLLALALLCLWPRLEGYWAERWQDLPVVALLLQPILLDHASWNSPTWSAAVEIACYFVFPILLFTGRLLPAAALLGLLACTGYIEYQAQLLYAGTWISLPCYLRGLADFVFGMNLSLLAGRFKWAAWLDIPAELMTISVFAAFCILRNAEVIPLAAGAVMWVLASSNGPVARVLSTGPLVYLGAISFSIYLTHMPIADLLNLAWPVDHPPLSTIFILRESLYFAVVLGISSLTYRFVEEPARNFVSGGRGSAAKSTLGVSAAPVST